MFLIFFASAPTNCIGVLNSGIPPKTSLKSPEVASAEKVWVPPSRQFPAVTAYGHDAEFVTAVPDNEIGECAVAALRKYNVETKHIARCGERLGIYYLESGSSMRPSKVVYDRAHSSISTATEADFNFDEIFEGADWFHFTGITPAVSDATAELTEKALIAAKKHGVKVSVDLNFRKKLWSSEKAQKVMTNLMKYVDVCIGNEEDAELVLGFKPGDTDVTSGELELAGYKSIFEQMVDKFNFEYCVSSLRVIHSASDNGWSACIYARDTKEFYHSKEYSIHPIVDRVGGGDSFAALRSDLRADRQGRTRHNSGIL